MALPLPLNSGARAGNAEGQQARRSKVKDE
jgi:hypothetical protein